MPEFLKLFGDALPKRERFSRLAAFWYTDIGPLNEVIHVWPYENASERSRIRADAVKDGSWPPATGELIRSMKAEIFEAMPGSPPFIPSDRGPFFEMSTHVLKPFTLPKMIRHWNEYLSGRDQPQALTGVFASDVGDLNRWVHIWAYRRLEERTAIRSDPIVNPGQPWKEGEVILEEETKILFPAPFSPIR
ncbi:hypothetical protein LMTR13_08050 [Bradyrhizobium icense]|uniref:NIPSNAP domain-containing protein n=1 Tax=Bradyrhizobium icense TaxID=1274631 RepID=A0A1B1UBK0_9BRAD|nr:hypothetical protein LMTR13_08050 [Bradyrhizobium icense]